MKKTEFLKKIKGYNPNYDMELIGRAYDVAEEMHQGQIRKSGEPYLTHPMAVAEILADLGMGEETIAAGLLHDVVEDTSYTMEEMQRDFGEEVADLVDGVTKLGALKFESKEERQAENLRKMFLAMSKDIRVLIIKLSDRLHNLRTINYMTHEKIVEKCQETLDIYAPLAARLGIYSMKMELEDIALKFLDPEAYYDLELLKQEFFAIFKAEEDRQAISLFLNWFAQLANYGRIESADYDELEQVYQNAEEVKSMYAPKPNPSAR